VAGSVGANFVAPSEHRLDERMPMRGKILQRLGRNRKKSTLLFLYCPLIAWK